MSSRIVSSNPLKHPLEEECFRFSVWNPAGTSDHLGGTTSLLCVPYTP